MTNNFLQNQLHKNFYLNEDVLFLAKDLLGKEIHTLDETGQYTSGIIIETEAYCGVDDKGCHAYNGRRTKRTSTMYLIGGHVYIYLCYGIHYLLNIVTNIEDIPHVVLIRAIQPSNGIDIMQKRRNPNKTLPIDQLGRGPGSITKALAITKEHNGLYLPESNEIWLTESDHDLKAQYEITVSTRIGIPYAGEDAMKPWRFYFANCPSVSSAK